MTKERVETIKKELNSLKKYCIVTDSDSMMVQLICYIQEILEAIPKED